MRGLLPLALLMAGVVLVHESKVGGEHFVILRSKVLFAEVAYVIFLCRVREASACVNQ